MNYRPISSSALRSSEIGFGCMSLLKTTTSEAEELIKSAIDSGINYFDTADLYDKGENEKLAGRILKNIILATKVGNQWKEDGTGWTWNPTKKYILKAVDDSLSRLQTDYIDLYQLHGGAIDDPIDETIEAFERLVETGKIRYYGISSIRPNVIREYARHSAIASVMMQYSLLDRRPEEEMLAFLKSSNISVMARGVLAQGCLAGKEAKDYFELSKDEVKNVQEKLNGMQLSRSNTAKAIGYVLHNQVVASAVIGFRTLKQLKEALAEGVVLQQADYQYFQQNTPLLKYLQHR
jgi:aryl-alcohol dehydrogenase-like predicted oxidoreductase